MTRTPQYNLNRIDHPMARSITAVAPSWHDARHEEMHDQNSVYA
jgi:hypothetical protein